MRQDELTREDQWCDHGFSFGTTCEKCENVVLRAENARLWEILFGDGWHGFHQERHVGWVCNECDLHQLSQKVPPTCETHAAMRETGRAKP